MNTTQVQDENIAFIKDEDKWPHWPLLPVKKYKEGETWPTFGTLVSPIENNGILWVVSASIFLLTLEMVTQKSVPIKAYDTVEEMVADGWMVD